MDLVEQKVPELLVMHSKSLIDGSAPWRIATNAESWGTDWIQFSAASGVDSFVHMIFFNAQSATETDNQLFTAYHSHLLRTETFVSQYRATSGMEVSPVLTAGMVLNSLSFALTDTRFLAPMIRCRFSSTRQEHENIVRRSSTEQLLHGATMTSSTEYRLIGSSRAGSVTQRVLEYLTVERHGPELEVNEPQEAASYMEGAQSSQPQSVNRAWPDHEIFRAVGSSSGLLSRSISGSPDTEFMSNIPVLNMDSLW